MPTPIETRNILVLLQKHTPWAIARMIKERGVVAAPDEPFESHRQLAVLMLERINALPGNRSDEEKQRLIMEVSVACAAIINAGIKARPKKKEKPRR